MWLGTNGFKAKMENERFVVVARCPPSRPEFFVVDDND